MLDVVKMKEVCRICARELCGNQRRWIFHPAAKINLQVLLSHAMGHELTRDGRGEFACSKCTFMLDRMYRFDTVIARVEALSLERLHKLLLEKEHLRQCIRGLYRKNNMENEDGAELGPGDPTLVDLSTLQDIRYSDLIQDDLTLSMYESWANKENTVLEQHTQQLLFQCPAEDSKLRRCRGCAALRVADSDYEAVCKVPRRVGRRSTSCGPSTQYSPGPPTVVDPKKAPEATTITPESSSAELDMEQRPSPALSMESLNTAVDMSCATVNHKGEETEAVKDSYEAPGRRGRSLWDKPPGGTTSPVQEYRPVQRYMGSRLPVLVKAKLERGLSLPLPVPPQSPCTGTADYELWPHQNIPEVETPCPQQELQAELSEMEEQWLDNYVECGPLHSQQRQMEKLNDYDDASVQCVWELHQSQQQVCSLQAKIRASESRNQKLQELLSEMALELRSAQEEAQRQDRNIQNITDTAKSKDTQATELCHVIEEQNKMLCSLKELANRSQVQQLQASGTGSCRGQDEVLVLQASLFQAQLQIEAGERVQQQAARKQEDMSRSLQRLENDLQRVLHHGRATQRHNQDMQLALEKAQLTLREREEQLSAAEEVRQKQEEEGERMVRELQMSLRAKEQLIEDYELLQDPKDKRDSLHHKLRQRIKDRDKALERAVDEKFRCMEEKEEVTQRLHLLHREKERDSERQRCMLANNEETITSLETLRHGQALELEQVTELLTSVQRQQQQSKDKQNCILQDRDNIISQLQGALLACTQEAQDLRCSLIAQTQPAPTRALEELKLHLQLKDRLLQEVLADRIRQAQEHQEQVQDLLQTISSRDLYIQDSSSRLREVIAEQTVRLQELRRQLSSGPGLWTAAIPELKLQALQEELQLALRMQTESKELGQAQTARVEALSHTLKMKEEIIRDFQRQLSEPPVLSLVEHLTKEVQELRESLVQQEGPLAQSPVLGQGQASSQQPEFGGGHQRSLGL